MASGQERGTVQFRHHKQRVWTASDFCGEPLCTLAHVYSCSATDCVQLTAPEKQFSPVYGGDEALIAIGRYLLISGGAMALIIITVHYCCPSMTSFIAVHGAIFFAVGTCALLAGTAIWMDLNLKAFSEKVVPTMIMSIERLVVVSLVGGFRRELAVGILSHVSPLAGAFRR